MSKYETVENYWTKELSEEVEIIPRGFQKSPDDFCLYISGTFVVSYRNLSEIEDYLATYFVKSAAR